MEDGDDGVCPVPSLCFYIAHVQYKGTIAVSLCSDKALVNERTPLNDPLFLQGVTQQSGVCYVSGVCVCVIDVKWRRMKL